MSEEEEQQENSSQEMEAVQITSDDLSADVETSTTLDDGWIEYLASVDIPDNVSGVDAPQEGDYPEPQGDTRNA